MAVLDEGDLASLSSVGDEVTAGECVPNDIGECVLTLTNKGVGRLVVGLLSSLGSTTESVFRFGSPPAVSKADGIMEGKWTGTPKV